MAFGGGGFFGSGASQSEAFGGQVGSTDTFANNNAYASAPVINFTDSRKASGKYMSLIPIFRCLPIQRIKSP